MTHKTTQITALFRCCLALRTRFNEIESDLENIHEIAMNASVAAGQTANLIRIFSEIANQISQTVRRMNLLIPSLRDEVNHTMNSILRILVIERRLKKYQLALPQIHRPSNQVLIKRIIQKQYLQIEELAKKANSYLRVVETLSKSLSQYFHRLYATHEMLKMEATHLNGANSEAILQLAEHLSQVTSRGLDQTADITVAISQIRFQNQKFQSFLFEEDNDAKTLAV